MPKYVDADALKEAFLFEGKDVCDAIDDFDTKWGASQKLIEEVIDSAPAADVIPVEWLKAQLTSGYHRLAAKTILEAWHHASRGKGVDDAD